MIKKVSENPFLGELTRKDIRKMVKHYRTPKDPKNLKYSHFRLKDVLKVFATNGVLPPKVVEALNLPESQEHLSGYGLKIYIGRHVDESTLPEREGGLNSIYLNKDTTILVNTNLKPKKVERKGFKDMLSEKLLLIGAEAEDDGLGLDRAEIEPPFHVGAGSNYYDVGEENDPQ